MRWLRWAAPAVAVAAVFFLPALEASAPFSPAQSWSIAGLAGEITQAASTRAGNGAGDSPTSLRGLLQQARALRQQWPGGSPQGKAALDHAIELALLIPIAALLAGICALLSFLATALGRKLLLHASAILGLLGSLYAIAASWWLTRTARNAVDQALSRAQHSFGGILNGLDWKRLQSGLTSPLGLAPQVGLFVLALAFLAVLIAPTASPN